MANKLETVGSTIAIPDEEARRMLAQLVNEDWRDIGTEVAWLVRQEYARRYSRPNPGVTVEEAQEAAS